MNPQVAIASGDMDKDELLHHLVQDHLWKLGIVTIAAVVVLTAMAVIHRKVGTE